MSNLKGLGLSLLIVIPVVNIKRANIEATRIPPITFLLLPFLLNHQSYQSIFPESF